MDDSSSENAYAKLRSTTSGFVAKTEYDSDDHYLPYWMHAVDTMLVASWLTDKLITDQQWENLLEDAGETELLDKTIRFIALTHDIGKLSSGFLQRILVSLPEYDLPEYTPYFKKFSPSGSCRHDLIGEMILRDLGVSKSISSIVGSHHGTPQSSSEEPDSFYIHYSRCIFGGKKKGEWKGVWKKTLEASLELCGLDCAGELPEFSIPNQMILSGLLIAADWLASNQMYFPCIPTDHAGREEDYPERFKQGIRKLRFSSPWSAQPGCMNPGEFRTTFGFSPRETQKEVLGIVEKVKDPGLLIIEAQMGIGKTEAALSAAEGLASKAGSGGIYFGLPTQATANALFGRLKSWAENRSFLDYESLTLNHGKAELNPEFAAMIDSAESLENSGEEKSHLFVNPWMRRKQLALLPNFVFGTIDGLLMSVLQKKHVALRHLGASAKVIILDEIHAYDAYTNVYLNQTLNWLGAYRLPVILLSATLADEKREEMIRSYLKGRYGNKKGRRIPVPDSERYPKITWTDGEEVLVREVEEPGIRTGVKIRKASGQEFGPDQIRLLQKLLDGKGAGGIIVNTVKKAQRLAQLIRETSPEQEIIVMHSRFTDADRSRIEQELLGRIGKESDYAERKGLIVIGTQVLEQSLDIDLDVILTELAPMDLLLQRIGRLHRHESNQALRPEQLREAVCFVFGATDGELDPGSSRIYDPWILERTRELLPEQLTLPDDIAPLVRETYRTPEDESDPLYTKYNHHKNQKEAKAGVCLLKTAADQSTYGCLDNLFDMQALSEAQGENSVRDIEESISVILVRDRGGNQIEMVAGSEILYSDYPPGGDQLLKLLGQKISLPASLGQGQLYQIVSELERKTISRFGAWQSVPQLRGELFLVLDECSQARLGDQIITYSTKTGLSVSKEEKEE